MTFSVAVILLVVGVTIGACLALWPRARRSATVSEWLDPTTPSEGCRATPEQLAWRLRSSTDAELDAICGRILDNAETASRCFMSDHEGAMRYANRQP